MSTFIDCYPGDRAIDFLLVVSLCVAFLSSTAWIVSQRLARKAALRHLVLLAALGCCLASPGLALFCNAVGFRLVSFPILCERSVTNDADFANGKQFQCEPLPASTESPRLAAKEPLSQASGQSDDKNFGVAATPGAKQTVLKQSASAPEAWPATTTTTTVSSFRGLATGAMVIWAVGVCLMLARLARNCLRVVRHRRSARPVTDDRIQTVLKNVVSQLGIRQSPLLLISNHTLIPLAVGLGRPAVILPERLLGVEIGRASCRERV
jgi:hypothetical protein